MINIFVFFRVKLNILIIYLWEIIWYKLFYKLFDIFVFKLKVKICKLVFFDINNCYDVNLILFF